MTRRRKGMDSFSIDELIADAEKRTAALDPIALSNQLGPIVAHFINEKTIKEIPPYFSLIGVAEAMGFVLAQVIEHAIVPELRQEAMKGYVGQLEQRAAIILGEQQNEEVKKWTVDDVPQLVDEVHDFFARKEVSSPALMTTLITVLAETLLSISSSREHLERGVERVANDLKRILLKPAE